MKTKKTLLTFILSATLLVTQPAVAATGVPTVDWAAVAAWNTQAKQMIEQINQFKSQVENQINHLKAIKGARGIGKAYAFLDMVEAAPEEWADIYDTVKGINSKDVLDKIQIDPDLEIKHAEKLKQDAVKDMEKLGKIYTDLDKIAKEINAGKVIEPKDAADLANRLQLNTAMITAMNAKYDILERQMKQQERLQEQKMRNDYKKADVWEAALRGFKKSQNKKRDK